MKAHEILSAPLETAAEARAKFYEVMEMARQNVLNGFHWSGAELDGPFPTSDPKVVGWRIKQDAAP